MEMMAVLLALLIPYLMTRVQPNGFITQIIFSLSLIINGLAVFITGLTISTDLLMRPIMMPGAAECTDICTWTLAEPVGAVAFTFLVVMCMGGIGMLYTAIFDRKYSINA